MHSRVMSFWSMALLGSTTIGDRWGLATGGIASLAAGLRGLVNLRNTHHKSANEAGKINPL
jgi:hypothetical protein